MDDAYLENKGLVQQLSQRYPAFKEYLETGAENASKFYNEANGLEEEARTAKLEMANSAFGAAFQALKQYVRLERSIKSKMDRLDRTRAKSYSTGADKRALWDDSDRLLEETHKAIAEFKPANEGEAAAEVLRQVARLQTLENRISKVLDRAKREERRDRDRKKKRNKNKNR